MEKKISNLFIRKKKKKKKKKKKYFYKKKKKKKKKKQISIHLFKSSLYIFNSIINNIP